MGNPEALSSFKKATKPREFQIFGSGSERFPDKFKHTNKSIGPGKYNRNTTFIKKGYNKNLRRAPFNSGNRRFELTKNVHKVDIPGPGTYEDEQTLKSAIEKKVVNSNDKPFNHTSIRFQNLYGINENPGPGAYYDEKNQIIIEGDDEIKASHMFKSNVRRGKFASDQLVSNPPVG